MRQHKYCMHSIKKIGACRKRKKKKSLSAGDLRSPGPAATRNRCVHHLRQPRSRPPSRLSHSPCLLRLPGRRAGGGAGEGPGGSGVPLRPPAPSAAGCGGAGAAPPPPPNPRAVCGVTREAGVCVCVCVMHAEGCGPREWELGARF